MLTTILTLAALGGGAWAVKKKLDKTEYGVLTPARELVFKSTMAIQHTPEKIRDVANAFEACGLHAYARLLHKKADSAELPPEQRSARQEMFRKAMSSTNVEAIEEVANAFEQEGIQISAEKLREYAAGLRAKAKVEVHESPIAPVPEKEKEVLNGTNGAASHEHEKPAENLEHGGA